jgi:DNA invertase Pin-like site-specific DNA recombinase
LRKLLSKLARAVRDYLDGGSWQLVGEFDRSPENGRHAAGPELAKALAQCKRELAKLVIAKVDRLSRNVAFLAALMDRGVDLVLVERRLIPFEAQAQQPTSDIHDGVLMPAGEQ